MKDKYLTLFKENREMAYFIGSVVGFGLLFFTLGLFLLFEAKSNFAQVEALKNRLIGIRRFEQQHADFASYRGELEGKLNRLEEEIPLNIDVNSLLLRVNTLAMVGNVKIDNLCLVPDMVNSRKSAYKSNRLQIACSGPCQQLLDFMKAVEQQDNLMLFSDVVMESKDNNVVYLTAVINYFTR